GGGEDDPRVVNEIGVWKQLFETDDADCAVAVGERNHRLEPVRLGDRVVVEEQQVLGAGKPGPYVVASGVAEIGRAALVNDPTRHGRDIGKECLGTVARSV